MMAISISADEHIACVSTIQRFSTLVDEGRYEDAAQMFTPEGVLQRPNERIAGRSALLASFATRPPHRLTRHILSNTTLEPVAADVIHALSYVSVYRHLGQEGQALDLPVAARAPETIAEYQDELQLVDGMWRIRHRRVTPIFDSN